MNAAEEVIDVAGIVDHAGASGSTSKHEGFWTLRFRLLEWRRPGLPIEPSGLQVLQRMAREEMHLAKEKIRPCTAIHLRVRDIKGTISGRVEATLVEIVGPYLGDAELNALVIKHQAPVYYEDEQFGIFLLDKRIKWYAGNAVWCAATISLHLNLEEAAMPTDQLDTARELWASQDEWMGRVLDYAVTDMLETKNDYWLGDGEARLDSYKFKSRMILESIGISEGGRFEFWFDDGDIFWGHSIYVDGNLVDGPTNAGFHG